MIGDNGWLTHYNHHTPLAGYRVPPMYNNYYHFLANKTEDPLPSLLSTISYHVALIHYLAL